MLVLAPKLTQRTLNQSLLKSLAKLQVSLLAYTCYLMYPASRPVIDAWLEVALELHQPLCCLHQRHGPDHPEFCCILDKLLMSNFAHAYAAAATAAAAFQR